MWGEGIHIRGKSFTRTFDSSVSFPSDSGPTTRLEPTSTSSDSLQPATSDTWAYDEPLTDSYPRESLKHHWSIIRELHANGGQGHKNVIRLLQEYDSLMMSGTCLLFSFPLVKYMYTYMSRRMALDDTCMYNIAL